jgi:putative ABC transport system substrate-binding protein
MRRRQFALLLGNVLTMARTLRAEEKPVPVIGFISGGAAVKNVSFVAAFLQGLGEIGYVDGRNVAIEYRWAEDRYDRLPALAADLVGRSVDVIAAGNLPSALAAKHATSTIPIAFEVGGDPVEHGLVTSLARPGGNLTGVSSLTVELTQKRVELLSELVPKANVIALLVNPNNPTTERVVRNALEAAAAKGVQPQIVKAAAEGEIESAFADLVKLHAGALVLVPDPFFYSRHEQFLAQAARHAVPTIYPWREFVAAGGLISYGPNLTAAFRQLGIYTAKILKGAKPADLPVEQSTKLELIINLKTANALGLTVPPTILARADEVIE